MNDIHPYAWWVKIKDVPGAPDGFELRANGTLLGRWREPDGASTVHVLTAERMRRLGYEKCFCDPTDAATVAQDCPAHRLVCI